MKIAWISESGIHGKVARNFPNCRTDVAWLIASDGFHIPYTALLTNWDSIEEFDVGIFILPKRVDALHALMQHLPNKEKLQTKFRNIMIMQEGPYWYYQDYPVYLQAWYLNRISTADGILVHNEMDQKYYSAFNKRTEINQSVMIEDSLEHLPIVNEISKRKNTIIGGNFVRWYGGMDSKIIADIFDEPIYAPSMGRKPISEDEYASQIGITHLPYMEWNQWIAELSKFKYAVHLMSTAAAGTFALNCGYLGIPCIGNIDIDTQRNLFPYASVKIYDLKQAVDAAVQLQNAENYEYQSIIAKKIYKEKYHESVWKRKFMTDLYNMLKI